MHVNIEPETATALYAGIITDTGSFRYPNTGAFTHQAAAELMRCGIDSSAIYRQLYQSIPIAELKILGKILPMIKRAAGGKIAWFSVSQKSLGVTRVDFDLSDQVLAFGRAVEGVEVAVLFRENRKAPEEIRVNLRSHGKVDVSKVASCFSGGGHKTASGCTVTGTLAQVRAKVIRKIEEQL